MKIHYIIHADFERPGIISTWAKKNGWEEKYFRPYAGEKLPEKVDCDFLVIMGGPQSPLSIAEAPYLDEEIAYIKKALEKGTMPILGVCLGAQLIGEALGAHTERSPNKEVGVYPIVITSEGQCDHFLKDLPAEFPVAHWHNDMPGLTGDAEILAYSAGCPRQIVRYKKHVYGLQCHIELSHDDIAGMIKNCPEDLAPGVYVESADELLSHDYADINRTMIHILDNLIESHQRAMKVGK